VILYFFKKSFYGQIALVILFAILFSIPNFVQSNADFWVQNTLFFKISCLAPFLKINWIYQSVVFILVVLFAFYIKDIFTRHQLNHHLNFLPSLLFIALFNFTQPFQYQLIAILNLFLIAFTYSYLLQSFEDHNPNNNYFGAAILISLSSFLGYGNVFMITLVWISFFVFQNYNWRYLPITLIGLVTPYIFLFSYLFWYDFLFLAESEWKFIVSSFLTLNIPKDLFYLIIFGLLSLFLLLSLMKIIPETAGKIISIRKKTSLTLWFLFIGLIAFFLGGQSSGSQLYLIPLVGVVGYYLRTIKKRKIFFDIVLTVFILLLLANKYHLAYASKVLFE
jgi:hypothetical protein